jgi:hypothetical protein
MNKLRNFCLLFTFFYGGCLFGQNRLIRPLSHIEDRLIALDPTLIESFRFNNQNLDLMSQLLEKEENLYSNSRKARGIDQESFFRKYSPEFFVQNIAVKPLDKHPSIPIKSKLNTLGFLNNPHRFYSWESEDKQDFIVVNPVFDMAFTPKFSNFSSSLLNGKGLEVYGQIGPKISFYSSAYDYQMNPLNSIHSYRIKNRVLPGNGFVNVNFLGYLDYFYATGYVNALLAEKKSKINPKNTIYSIHATFGHDKQFMGSGFRSLLLSNFAPPSLFLQLNYRLGPFKYQNLFKELVRDLTKDTFKTYNKKYLAMHRGSLEFKSIGLELGVSESIIHYRMDNSFDLNYINPIIFYRGIERELGSSDNAIIALDGSFKRKRWNAYGQLLMDEFNTNYLFTNRKHSYNKFAYQLGFYLSPQWKNIKQSYFQFEWNSVRPFTYSHYSASNYSHYGQALAHPLESNFREFVFRTFIIPDKFRKLSIKNTLIVYNKGLNVGKDNYGSDLRLNYHKAVDMKNAPMLQGNLLNGINNQLVIKYLATQSFHIEGVFNYERLYGAINSQFRYLGIGIRWNFMDSKDAFML